MNVIEENVQKYQLIQDDKIYILSTGLVGQNLKIACYEYKDNNNENIGYASIYTIQQLQRANPVFKMTQDCEDVQWMFEDVILDQSVGILEKDGFLDVYFYIRANGRISKVILRLNWQKSTPPPSKINEYQSNQERLTRLQYNANQLLDEQNALRKQIDDFFADNSNSNANHTRSRSTNQNNNYHNQLNGYNITNNMAAVYNNQDNNMTNLRRVEVNEDDDSEVYEVPPVNDIAP